jgi:hypothetical protein
LKFFATLLLLALLCAAFVAYLVYAPIGPATGTSDAAATYVDIVPGTGTQAIAEKLERAGIIRSRFAFDLLRVIKGGKLIAGEYSFNHPAAATEVYERMARGDVSTVTLTIPEGYNIFDIAQAVASAGLAPRDAFLAAERTQTSLIADLSPDAPSAGGPGLDLTTNLGAPCLASETWVYDDRTPPGWYDFKIDDLHFVTFSCHQRRPCSKPRPSIRRLALVELPPLCHRSLRHH